MAVKVLIKASGENVSGKYCVVEKGQVALYSGIMSDKKGGFRGCGKKRLFDAAAVTWAADEPAREVRQR